MGLSFNRNASSGSGSQGNNNSNFYAGLQGLFGNAQQNQNNFGAQFADTGYTNYLGMPTLPSTSQLAQRGGQGSTLEQRTVRPAGMGAGGAPTYGQVMSGGLVQDYQNTEAARQRELAMYGGLLGGVQSSMQGAGQMVQDARNSGNQNMAGFMTQADDIRRAAAGGEQYYGAAKDQMLDSLGEARTRFDQGIGSLQAARANYDSTNRSDTAGEVFGVQSQYKNQLDAIARQQENGQLNNEQATQMTAQLKQSMQQQSSMLASQADAKARDTLLALDQNISQMQSAAGAQLGQFGIGIGQSMGQLGMQSAQMQQQAAEQIGNFYNNMAQFNSSLLQSAEANALQHTLNGNQLAASLINQMPLGPISIFETLTRMVSSGDFRRNQQVSPQMAGLFGGLA
jgi:ribosomal protein L22